MEATKCTECFIETFQRDGICIVCKSGVNQMHKELMDLVKKDKKSGFFRVLKMLKQDKKSTSNNHKRRVRHVA